jgi:hypothetical protein
MIGVVSFLRQMSGKCRLACVLTVHISARMSYYVCLQFTLYVFKGTAVGKTSYFTLPPSAAFCGVGGSRLTQKPRMSISLRGFCFNG